MQTNMTDRERQRFAEQARELALAFIDLAEGIENDQMGVMAARSIVISITGPAFLREITDALKASLPESLQRALDEEEGGL